MRISPGSRPLSSRLPSGTQEKNPLQRSEAVSDLFNNPINKEEEKGEVKLRLSYASRRFSKKLREDVDAFLKENPGIATSFEAIELPNNAYSRIEINKEPVRKMSAYLNWARIHEGRTEEPEEAEAPFLSLHESGKDEEMRALFERPAGSRHHRYLRRTHPPLPAPIPRTSPVGYRRAELLPAPADEALRASPR